MSFFDKLGILNVLGTQINPATSDQIGEVQASPTANTLLDRLKSIYTALTGTLTVSGTVTADAGTDLNTSALALETGGNLDTIAGKDFATETTLTATNTILTDNTQKTQVVDSTGTSAKVEARATAPTGNALNVQIGPSEPATFIPFVSNYPLSVARGLIAGVGLVHKFGAAPSGIQTTATDIWDRANATPTQQIWIAPTAARIHAIVSTSALDVAGSTGATSVVVYGLKTWATAETSETVNLNGIAPVNTVNSYVIIHRMVAVGQATTTAVGINAGTISATAATDATVTAVISIGNGQTEMAIYGVPSTQTFYMTEWAANIDKSGAVAATADFELRANTNPDVQRLGFTRRHDISLQSDGTCMLVRHFTIPMKFAGPCIIKVQAIASAADLDGEATFDGYLVTN